MENSILNSIKKPLNVDVECNDFDIDIIMDINSVFFDLNQLGYGPSDGFAIDSSEETWDQYSKEKLVVEAIKSFIYLKVRLMFDPPSNSVVTDSINRRISELEYKLCNVYRNPAT